MTNNIVRVGNQTLIGSNEQHPPRKMKDGFDARLFWGDRHVLPRIEASGRWENFPICRHPGIGYDASSDTSKISSAGQKSEAAKYGGGNSKGENDVKKHKLIACLWASASFTTR